tara:strand:+ start:1525 stop:2151 length:627 start_codon:yes stop_codon:yes gene_type:complete
MGRYRGPMVKLSKRLKVPLTPKCQKHFALKNIDLATHQRNIGSTLGRRKKMSTYGVQLWEKQKLLYAYGVREKQLQRYYEKAKKSPITGEGLLQLLESRLDNVIFRMGFARSRAQARQWVVHGHFLIDGGKARTPSIHVSPGSVISLKEGSKIAKGVQGSYVDAAAKGIPEYVKVDGQKLEGIYNNLPSRSQIDFDIQENLVVEYYSR